MVFTKRVSSTLNDQQANNTLDLVFPANTIFSMTYRKTEQIQVQ